jgi:hypothetical protein
MIDKGLTHAVEALVIYQASIKALTGLPPRRGCASSGSGKRGQTDDHP